MNLRDGYRLELKTIIQRVNDYFDANEQNLKPTVPYGETTSKTCHSKAYTKVDIGPYKGHLLRKKYCSA